MSRLRDGLQVERDIPRGRTRAETQAERFNYRAERFDHAIRKVIVVLSRL